MKKYPHRQYKLVEFDPIWKGKFLKVSDKVKSILGENLLEVNHIGSTSIEGMTGKPQVDILVVVKNLDLVEKHNNDFTKEGFTVHGKGYVADDDYYITEDSPDGVRLTSIHILQDGNPKIRERKIFRDYLENNKEDRDLYVSTKKKLYEQHSDDYRKYVAGKKDVIGEIMARALVWAKSSHDSTGKKMSR